MLSECQCLSCKHNKSTDNEIFCDAFPTPTETEWHYLPCAIPREILSGKFIHTKPYPGDNGIMYEFNDS